MKDASAVLFLENQLCFPLYAASRLTTKVYAPYLDEMGLTYPQYLVLLVLWQHGSCSMKQIGEQLFLESNTLTPLVKRLEQKDVIRRDRSEKDERTVIVSLTSQGEALKEEAKVIPQKIIESFKDPSITEEELLTLQKTLFRLVELLGEKTSGD
ncbi:MarR family winged helix-turn-helix transcriptional regulator [Roseivirga sp. BDSF3-8]|uniref:MarR family winged helix-turn-helix transcriptional regulator n=1 Tax=Roseivirga sp. BDSF3-8 TaxID=3241598 RepID=UPI003531CC51